jgi:hypothetical protein
MKDGPRAWAIAIGRGGNDLGGSTKYSVIQSFDITNNINTMSTNPSLDANDINTMLTRPSHEVWQGGRTPPTRWRGRDITMEEGITAGIQRQWQMGGPLAGGRRMAEQRRPWRDAGTFEGSTVLAKRPAEDKVTPVPTCSKVTPSHDPTTKPGRTFIIGARPHVVGARKWAGVMVITKRDTGGEPLPPPTPPKIGPPPASAHGETRGSVRAAASAATWVKRRVLRCWCHRTIVESKARLDGVGEMRESRFGTPSPLKRPSPQWDSSHEQWEGRSR